MQIETLQLFCDVVATRSFSQAAVKNHVTQSSASQAVQRLEDHLGSSLIDRSFRPWRLTDAGQRCYERAQTVIRAYQQLENEFAAGEPAPQQVLRLSCIYSVGFSYGSEIIRKFERCQSDTTLQIDYAHPAEIMHKILSNEIDMGILSYPPARRDMQVQMWCDEDMVAVCVPGHRLALRRSLHLRNLNGLSLVSFDADLRIGKSISQFLRQNQVRMHVALRFDNIEAIKRAVENSDYVAILPRPSVEREVLARSLVALPFADANLTRPLGVVWRKNHDSSPAMAALLAILNEIGNHS